MTKADIVNLVFEKVGLPKNEAQEMVETVFDTIKQTLIAGESIKISGFGTFNVRKKNSRIGRNPKTKEEVEITPRRVVTFKASDQLKELIEKM
ncbi:MAG: integration host factor subunit alpha [Thermodesulfovibrionales bacterium]|jgi:integration host factor subunit alpha|nr:integration host factor subunit alpha [Thermodesulfovibrionales bacterium]